MQLYTHKECCHQCKVQGRFTIKLNERREEKFTRVSTPDTALLEYSIIVLSIPSPMSTKLDILSPIEIYSL